MISLILFAFVSLIFCKVERYYSYNYSDSDGHSINYKNNDGEKHFSAIGYDEKDRDNIQQKLEAFENHPAHDFYLPSIFSDGFFNFPSLYPSNFSAGKQDATSLEIANLEKKLTKYDNNIEQYSENKKNIDQAIEKANKRLTEINEDFVEISKLVKKNNVSARLNSKLYDYVQQLKKERRNLNNRIENYKTLLKNNEEAITELEDLKVKINDKLTELKSTVNDDKAKKDSASAKLSGADIKSKTNFLTDEEIDNLFEQ